jgi:ABC-type nickel/cobalt efflux system permease component RcnA
MGGEDVNALRNFSILFSFFLCALCVLRGEKVFAHPVPKDNHDRIIDVRLTPSAVVVKYLLEVDESRAQLELSRAELTPSEFARLTSADAIRAAFRRYCAPILGGNLFARLDGGKPLTFKCKEQNHKVDDHLLCEFEFTAPWKPSLGKPHTFDFREANYDRDDFNRLAVTLSAERGVKLETTTVPDKALIERPPLERKPGDDERLRRVSATFVLTEASESPSQDQLASQPEATTAPAEEEHPRKLLDLLLDTKRGLVVLLFLAAGFGAVHALTPGHGKTLVAAYLVGQHGTVWHALLLGLMTTLTHTGAVFILAFVFLISPEAAQAMNYVGGLIGGLFIAALGMWLLLCRLSGRADHFHLGGHSHHHHHHHDHDHDHDHHHDHVHDPIVSGASVRWWHLVLLGLRGGIVPCWDAIILLCLAISAQRLRLAVPLLLAFSAGLAGVLVALGVSVVWARNWFAVRWGGGPHMRKLARALPLVSAALITILGLWLCYDSLHPETPPTSISRR